MADKWKPPVTLEELLHYLVAEAPISQQLFTIATPFGEVQLLRAGIITGDEQAIEWARVNYGKYASCDSSDTSGNRMEQTAITAAGEAGGDEICQLPVGPGAEASEERNSQGAGPQGMEDAGRGAEDEGEGGDDASHTI